MRFYFAWVDEDTPFNEITHAVEDEQVISFAIDEEEGQIPQLTLQIRNPRLGLLGPGRKIWAWFSWFNPGSNHVEPLFYGRIVAIPTNILAEAAEIKFVAQSFEYQAQKQQFAQTLKVQPYYDPIFLEPSKRDDPDSILEGYSALWNINRTTLAVSISDVMVGEDGTEEFTASEVPYDSVSVTLRQPPLNGVNVDATVNWTQRDTGFFTLGQAFSSYYGDTIMGSWPKPGASLGGGYTVLKALVVDRLGISVSSNVTAHFSWKNEEKHHDVGDLMSVETNLSYPSYATAPVGTVVIEQKKIAIIDPNDPDFHDQPTAWTRAQYIDVPKWQINATMSLMYQAARPRSERAVFTLLSNIQPVTTPLQSPPLPVEETIQLASSDVSEPVLNVLNWLTVRGQPVSFGQVIYPNNPTILGGTAFQFCKVAGVAGSVQPTFSDVPGTETVDGTVTWVSLGNSLQSVAGDWQPQTFYPLGTVIRPMPRVLDRNDTSPLTAPVTNNDVIAGVINKVNSTIFLHPATGVDFFVCIQAGDSAFYLPPTWPTTPGATVVDNEVIWLNITSAMDVPIGDMKRRSYLPTTRGQRSLEYMVARARAKLRLRARCIEVSFHCKFERAVTLSCRKSALLVDDRMPGGEVSGKVIKLRILGDADTMVFRGEVTLGCGIGYDGTVVDVLGDPSYVANGYVQPGYQYYEGNATAVFTGEVSYTTPRDTPVDDGLQFPVKSSDVITAITLPTESEAPKDLVILAAQTAAQTNLIIANSNNPQQQIGAQQNLSLRLQELAWQQSLIGQVLYVLEMKPLTNGPFNAEYQILVSPLELPQGIDLAAA